MDDFQKIWAKNPPPIEDLLATFRQARQREISDSATKLRGRILFEAIFVFGCFVALFWAWQTGKIYNSRMTGLLILGGLLTTMPVFWRLGRSILGFSKVDFSKNILENLQFSILKTRHELKIYKWSVYFFSIFMVVILLFEPFLWVKKLVLISFILLNMLLSKYWIRWMYGRELNFLEKKLNDWQSELSEK
jgi:hypothetical protein